MNTTVPSWFPAVNEGGVTFQPNGAILNFPGKSEAKVQGLQFNYTHLFSPNLVLELKTGYTRIDIETHNLNEGINASSAIGVVNANTAAAPGTTGLMPLEFLLEAMHISATHLLPRS